MQEEYQQEESQIEAGTKYRSVEDLQSVGINMAEIKKLREAGYPTIGTVLQQPLKVLIGIKGFSEARAEKVLDACRKLDSKPMFSTALDVKSLRKEVIKITSGASSLDKILGGGLETGSITEVFGEFRTGKTQLAHTLCVTSQLGFGMQGGQGKVIYLDTENNFRPERIEQVAQRFGLDTELTLENIVVGTASTSDEQMSMMAHICALLADPDQGPFRVLIVDSIISLFRVDFSGRGELSERQQKLNKHMKQLSNVAQEFNIVVLIVNQCQADPGALAMFGPVIKPVGGHVIAHASTTRIMLKKGKAEQRIAKIFDSPLMPEEEATFAISSGGIVDI